MAGPCHGFRVAGGPAPAGFEDRALLERPDDRAHALAGLSALAVAMQAIGLVGESLILWALPGAHPVARATVTRFIAFDGSGLILLLVAAWVTRGTRNLVSSG